MTPALQPTHRAAEKIMVVGSGGTGKTRGLMDIVKRCLHAGQTAYLIDNEQAIPVHLEAMGIGAREEWVMVDGKWERDEEWEDPGSPVVRYFCQEWLDHRDAIRSACVDAARGDWIGVDTISNPWEAVQAWYVGEITGGDEFADWMVKNRVAQIDAGKGNDGGAGALLGEWKVINQQWKDYVLNPVVKARAHVYLAAHSKTINTERDSPDVKSMWKGLGFKADCQKRVPSLMRTVLGLEENRGAGGGFVVTSVKDRERELLAREQMKSMPVTYLMGVAGWKMKP
jgi:hypothetical protein